METTALGSGPMEDRTHPVARESDAQGLHPSAPAAAVPPLILDVPARVAAMAVGNTKYAETYAFGMRDAHRKPSQAIRPPALARHLAFRRIPPKAKPKETEDDWIERIEAIIISVFNTLRAVSPDARISNLRDAPLPDANRYDRWKNGVELLKNRYDERRFTHPEDRKPEGKSDVLAGSRYETVVLGGTWRELPVWLRFEVFEEYFALTISLQLRTWPHSAENRRFNIDLDAVIGQANEYYRCLSNNDQLARCKSAGSGRCSQDASNIDALFSRVWADFNAEVLDPAFTVDVDVNPVGAVFADFRGLILALDLTAPADKRPAIRRPTSNTESEQTLCLKTRVQRDAKVFDDDEAIRWAEALMPILIAGEEQTREPPFESTEYTFSTFENRRCVYGSGFGTQLQADGGASPLKYVALFGHEEHRQIGTTINRLHGLGTLRLAALFDLNILMTRDQILLNLDHEMREQVEEMRSHEGLRKRRHEAIEELAHSVRKLGKLERELRNNADLLVAHLHLVPAMQSVFGWLFGERRVAGRTAPGASADASAGEGRAARRRRAAPGWRRSDPQGRFAPWPEPTDEAGWTHMASVEFPPQQSTPERRAVRWLMRTPLAPVRWFWWHTIRRDGTRPGRSLRRRLEGLRQANDRLHKVLGGAPSVSMDPQDRATLSAIYREFKTIERLLAEVLEPKDLMAYRLHALNTVRRSLGSMDKRIHHGITYRAVRSQYSLELFAAVAESMRIGAIEGFQQYDRFVMQRLQRSYMLIQAIDARYRQLLDREKEQRMRLQAVEAKLRSDHLNHMQLLAEFALVGVFVPHYLADAAKDASELKVVADWLQTQGLAWLGGWIWPTKVWKLTTMIAAFLLPAYWLLQMYLKSRRTQELLHDPG